MMNKIALFYKLSSKKVIFSVFIALFLLTKPVYAYAGFFSDIIDIFTNNEVNAQEIDDTNKVVHNSQTMQLLESTPAMNPDMKKVKEINSFEIDEDDALAVVPVSMGNDYDLEKNASDEKINVYIVKKGDTLNSIIKKFNTNEKAIIASNSDIKKSDLTKVGTMLVIVPIKVDVKALSKKQEEQDKKDKLAKQKADEQKKLDTEKKKQDLALEKVKKEEIVAPEPIVEEKVMEVTIPKEEIVPDENKIAEQNKDNTDKEDTGEQSGTINGGYIWPFAKGVGRISQGLHDDQAYDFSAPKGTPIYAIQDGTVLIAHPTGYNGGYGLYVVINFDDGRQAIFGHMSKVKSEAGDIVKRGDIIGYVGSTGRSTGPHVHIGFRGSLKNPYIGLKKGTGSSALESHD